MRITEIAANDCSFPVLVVWSERLQGWVRVADLVDCDSETTTVESVLREQGNVNLDSIREALEQFEASPRVNLPVVKTEDLKYQPLFTAPSKIMCIGLNYAGHVKEFQHDYPAEPAVFCKAPSSTTYCGAEVVLPPVSHRVDYEGELVAAIGKRGRHIPESDALRYVAGYCCGNDVSARDWQKEKPAGQWFLGKSFDTFAPVGPWLVTSDEVGDPNNLKIESRLNGRVMQSSSTTQFIYKVQRVVSYISQVMTLEPGDLLFTGTPNGVGDARKPPVYLEDGDLFEVEIEKLGVLKNPVRRNA